MSEKRFEVGEEVWFFHHDALPISGKFLEYQEEEDNIGFTYETCCVEGNGRKYYPISCYASREEAIATRISLLEKDILFAEKNIQDLREVLERLKNG